MRRHKGGYYTREDEGELGAKDPDTAVLRGVTGCKVVTTRIQAVFEIFTHGDLCT